MDTPRETWVPSHGQEMLWPSVTPAQIEALLKLGAELDAGMSAESVMLSLTGVTLREAACGFVPDETAEAVFSRVAQLKQALAERFGQLARKQPIGPLGELVRSLKPRS